MRYNFYTGEVLLIDKPLGWTSFQAVNKLKYGIKNHPSFIHEPASAKASSGRGNKVKPKIGHAGTLDPLATGLLIVCTGKKTKEIESFMGLTKEYAGTFFIGATTPCYDLEKEIDKTFPTEHITKELILETAKTFLGKQEQVPPLFSAVQINGKRAYEHARAGDEIELKPRQIEILEFEITDIQMPIVSFRIVCGKGTYIRSIARDFGLALNSGAHLTSLRRTKIGNYDVKDAVSPEEFVKQLQS
ncbi:MAG: tRNA pseudouridine(55) synthase TruB [Sphingobacteriaceae bacterium]|nr:tRNA pseudouridine(55) synthase TruB [Sphingobacteriaceae bacterium]MBK7312154.1 tRNA pseudouridine(55) synthase TruB [Sphingobacteriaceae bacterium]MBK7816865.1 tRNA pseudouridine(55) synthase TruB [Sphingobacteriaceae bacterium]